MNDGIATAVLAKLGMAIFERSSDGQLRVIATPPEWLTALWPEVAAPDDVLPPGRSPFLENFLIDAAAAWQAAASACVCSGPWLETDSMGRDRHLQATALTASSRPLLMIQESGTAYEERTAMVQRAHEVTLAYQQLQRVREMLAEQKGMLEQRVAQRTAELSQANAALRGEISRRQRYSERLEAMHQIDTAILAAGSPRMIAEAALRHLQPLLPCGHACVLELDSELGRGRILASVDHGRLCAGSGMELSSEQLKRALVLKSHRLHRTTDSSNLFDIANESGVRVWPLILDFPLIAEDELIGVLTLATQTPAEFNSEHEETARAVASQLAVAIRHAQLFTQVSAARQRLGALSQRVVDAHETERRLLARELHDEIGQVLTSLKLVLKTAVRLSGHESQTHLQEAVGMVDDLLERVRQLSLNLRPPVLDDLGLLPALDWLFKRCFATTGIRIQFKHTPVPGRWPATTETAVFRIVQEALTNVCRHACVKEATVRLWTSEGRCGVQIEDKGAGFHPEQVLKSDSSIGLVGMRERAVTLGGEFTLESAPGLGTQLTVELPLKADWIPPEAELRHP